MAKKQKKRPDPKPPLLNETFGVLIFSLSIALLISLISFATKPDPKNMIGLMGYWIGWTFHGLLGLGSYLLAFFLGWIGWRLLFSKPMHHLGLKSCYAAAAIVSTCILLSLVDAVYPDAREFLGNNLYPGLWNQKQRYHLGGALFYYLYKDLPYYNLAHVLNTLGSLLLFSGTLIASLVFLFKIQLSAYVPNIREFFKRGSQKLVPQYVEKTVPFKGESEEPQESNFMRFVNLRIPQTTQQESAPKSSSGDLLAIRPEKNLTIRPSVSRKEQSDEEDEPLPPQPRAKKEERKRESPLFDNGDFKDYAFPSLNLLSTPKKVDNSSLKKDLKRQAEVLEETLSSFGIEAKVGQINCGPTITSFEVHPAIGVKVQRIKALDNDIALNMEAKSIRIIAPIPGKAAVGIEVPNPQPQEVGFKDMLMAYQQASQKFHVPILLGKAVNGDYVTSDLTKMPHCIIAGATGSGKSVCINTIIMSILMNSKPNQIKLIMIDPKKVELTPYTRLPHMLAPVITEPQAAAAALKWLVKEMENRYDILKLVGARNIDSFNKRTVNAKHEEALEREIPPSMPYIVTIIDELADLMMVASQDIETPIARIAQMARAVGIHLILATQRPSREVITGLIKANFPTRVSFKVASRVNSQIVLDEIGAESLLGNGDMLFLPPGSSHLVRAQGAFIRDEDIQAVIQHICEQAPPNYIIQSFDQMINVEGAALEPGEEFELDSLYEQAKDVVVSTGSASTTFLQRKLKIGYARAASLMDQLEAQGVVGPADGSKPRKIYSRHSGANDDASDDEEEE